VIHYSVRQYLVTIHVGLLVLRNVYVDGSKEIKLVYG